MLKPPTPFAALVWPGALAAGVALAATATASAASTAPDNTAAARQPTSTASVDAQVHSVPTTMLVSAESVRLPGGERMGLLGLQYLFEPVEGWRFGPAAYGAATGRRGGLFTWGAEGQYVGRPAPNWQWSAGLYVGGGGGAGAPVGGGLMLRPHLDLWWRQPGWQVGLSASQVRFPSGDIKSPQLGLVLAFDDHFSFTGPDLVGSRVNWSGRSGVGFDRAQPLVGSYRFRGGASGSMGHVGIRLDRRLGPPSASGWVTTAGLEVAGAAHGGADGYAEGLGTLGLEHPLGGATVGVRAALGLAGGGALPTRGGGIGKLAAHATLPLGQQWFIGGEVGSMRALSGPLSARYVQLGLGFWLDQEGRSGHPSSRPPSHPVPTDVTGMRWGLSLQSYAKAARKSGSARAMQTIGLRFDRAVGEHFYLTGQAHSAMAGGAGAYSIGLVGLGATMPVAPNWRVGAEMLAGAAGGGGVAVQGGAVTQPMVFAVRDLGRYSQVHAGVGRLSAVKGGLSTPVAELSWTVAFGLPERR